MKCGVVERDFDVSGVTGTGPVATFVINDDGRVVIFWEVGEGIWPSLEAAIKVHGHNGNTRFVILDDDNPDIRHCKYCHSSDHLACRDHPDICPGCVAGVKV